MKINNWCKKIAATLVAAGFLMPMSAHALDIPLGDPSFETYVVPARGYAYATGAYGTYRPTSPWVDDLDNPQDGIPGPTFAQDDPSSNWLYTGAYAEAGGFGTKRPAPRTGNQAMHGLERYSAQETSATFQAGRTYTFSIWAQNDTNLNETNGLYMYIFDGTVQFNDANALVNTLFTNIPVRSDVMTPAESQANWGLLSVSHTVGVGASEIGHPIGVAFYAQKDTAVDDAVLSVVPEPTSVVLAGLSGVALLAAHRRRK